MTKKFTELWRLPFAIPTIVAMIDQQIQIQEYFISQNKGCRILFTITVVPVWFITIPGSTLNRLDKWTKRG